MSGYYALILFIATLFLSSESMAASTVCGADVVNNQNVDAAAPLQNCIMAASANGYNIVDLPPGRYYINGSINIGDTSNMRIRTQYNSSGAACLDDGANTCAVLMATPTNPGPSLLISTNASNLILDHIALDGNIAPRRVRYNNSNWAMDAAGRRTAMNGVIHACSGCQFLGFTSTRAAQGSGMEFYGDNAVFDGALFSENGWGATGFPNSWADGLTLLSSANAKVVNSKFIDNSDVDLIIGGAPNLIVSSNKFINRTNFSFAALMLDNFQNSQSGIFTNAIISNNSIDCSSGMCGIGIDLGPHFWYQSSSINGTGSLVSNNTITGAKQGILTAGAIGFSIASNIINANGAYAGENYIGCTANPLSVSGGDSVSVSNNNYGVFPNLLSGCGPLDLTRLVVHMANVSYTIAADYRAILGRDADASGGQYFSNLLASEASNNSDISMQMASSPESFNTLNAMYQKYLGRNIDSSGWDAHSRSLANGTVTVDQLRVNIQLSSEALSNPFRVY